MTDIKIVTGGVCKACGHKQESHESNTVCSVEGCDCTAVGSY